MCVCVRARVCAVCVKQKFTSVNNLSLQGNVFSLHTTVQIIH